MSLKLTKMNKRQTAVVKRPHRKCYEKGKDLSYLVLDIFETEDKNPKNLLKREIFRSCFEILEMHPRIFKTINQIYMFLRTHNQLENISFNSRSPAIRRRISLYRKRFHEKVEATGKPIMDQLRKFKKHKARHFPK